MAVWGADVDQLESLADLLELKARELDRIHRMLGQQLHAAPWVGPSADRFRNKWGTVHRRQMSGGATHLRYGARLLVENARQQREASSAAGGSSLCGPGVPEHLDPYEDQYARSRREIEERRAHLRREIDRLRGLEDEGGFREFLGDVNPLARSRQETREDEIRRLQAELDALDGLKNLDDRQILSFDAAPGDHRIVEVHGDLANAKRVVIHIPGINTDLGDYADGHSNAKDLFDQVQAEYGPDVVVISFADYNIPDDLLEAAGTGGANDGAAALRAFVADLHAQGFSTEQISVVAHSYGTVVAGHAMQDGLDVGRVIALGSPGMGADSRAGLGSPAVDLWAASAPVDVTRPGLGALGDPVSWGPAHGENPAADGFGANRFDVPDAYGHSTYFASESQALENIGRLAVGRAPR